MIKSPQHMTLKLISRLYIFAQPTSQTKKGDYLIRLVEVNLLNLDSGSITSRARNFEVPKRRRTISESRWSENHTILVVRGARNDKRAVLFRNQSENTKHSNYTTESSPGNVQWTNEFYSVTARCTYKCFVGIAKENRTILKSCQSRPGCLPDMTN